MNVDGRSLGRGIHARKGVGKGDGKLENGGKCGDGMAEDK